LFNVNIANNVSLPLAETKIVETDANGNLNFGRRMPRALIDSGDPNTSYYPDYAFIATKDYVVGRFMSTSHDSLKGYANDSICFNRRSN